MKPMNFPERKERRRRKAQGIVTLSRRNEKSKVSRSIRGKKKP